MPTDIGNICYAFCRCSFRSVHPHGCGEHVFIPNVSQSSGAVHPHGCGEHVEFVIPDERRYGSPPRVWGAFLNHLHL